MSNAKLNLALAEEFIDEHGESVTAESLDDSVHAFVRTAKQSACGAVVAHLQKEIDARKVQAIVKKRIAPIFKRLRMKRAANGETLAEFAKNVLQVARASKAGKWHDDAVFISHVWKGMKDAGTLAAFKKRLVEAHRADLLELSRADLVESMHLKDVVESEIPLGSYRLHFVRI